MSEFATLWQHRHPLGPPVAHLLRKVPHEHWVRFHSLPLSKRYAETPTERRTVLERANTLASRVIGESSDCWLVQADPNYDGSGDGLDPYGSITQLGLAFDFEHRDPEDECTYRIYSKLVTWSAGMFNDLIAQRADDLLPIPTMWVSARNGAVFAPYDGGSDLFLQAAGEVAELKCEFSGWLSEYPTGL